MFSRTAVKRISTLYGSSSANYSGSAGSSAETTIAFIVGVGIFPASLVWLNFFPSTRRNTDVPMYDGMSSFKK